MPTSPFRFSIWQMLAWTAFFAAAFAVGVAIRGTEKTDELFVALLLTQSIAFGICRAGRENGLSRILFLATHIGCPIVALTGSLNSFDYKLGFGSAGMTLMFWIPQWIFWWLIGMLFGNSTPVNKRN